MAINRAWGPTAPLRPERPKGAEQLFLVQVAQQASQHPSPLSTALVQHVPKGCSGEQGPKAAQGNSGVVGLCQEEGYRELLPTRVLVERFKIFSTPVKSILKSQNSDSPLAKKKKNLKGFLQPSIRKGYGCTATSQACVSTVFPITIVPKPF